MAKTIAKYLDEVLTQDGQTFEQKCGWGSDLYTREDGMYLYSTRNSTDEITYEKEVHGKWVVNVPMPETTVAVTEMQAQLLLGFMRSEYHSTTDSEEKLDESIWSFSMIENANLDANKAAGALASLKIKGLVEIGAVEKGDVRPIGLTALGRTCVRELGLSK